MFIRTGEGPCPAVLHFWVAITTQRRSGGPTARPWEAAPKPLEAPESRGKGDYGNMWWWHSCVWYGDFHMFRSEGHVTAVTHLSGMQSAHTWLARRRAGKCVFAAVVFNCKQAPKWGSVYWHGRVIQQLSRAPPASKRQTLICGSGVSAGQWCDEKPYRWQCPSE